MKVIYVIRSLPSVAAQFVFGLSAPGRPRGHTKGMTSPMFNAATLQQPCGTRHMPQYSEACVLIEVSDHFPGPVRDRVHYMEHRCFCFHVYRRPMR